MWLLSKKNRNPRALLAAVTIATAAGRAVAADAPPPAAPQDVAADAALADRFEALAELSFPAQVPTGRDRAFVFAQQAAILHAARVLDPTVARYPRDEAEALEAAGDTGGEVLALRWAYTAKSDDEFVLDRLMDLNLASMQNAQKQATFLQAIEGRHDIPADVAAHADVRLSQIYVDQGKDTQALATLKLALTHDPFNNQALRLNYRLLAPKATPFERAKMLIDLLRANPLQPAYARDLARLVADQGMVQESLPFFNLSVNTAFNQRQPDVAAALDWAAELFIANQLPDARKMVGTILSASPDYAAAWFLDLLVVRSGGVPQAQQDQELQRATVVLSNRVANAVNAALDLGGPPGGGGGNGGAAAGGRGAGGGTATPRATTRPMESEGAFPLPDPAPAVAALKGSTAATQPAVAEAARSELVMALADLARLEILFAHKPDAAAPLIDALRQLLPTDGPTGSPTGSPLVAQLQGLQSLAAGDLKAAGATLAPIAATDPLAGMGLVQVQLKTGGNQPAAERAARTLIQDHPDGLVGAFLVEALSSPNVRLIPTAVAAKLSPALTAFPHDLFLLGSQPSRVYSIHAEPVDIGRSYGQPLLARVTIFNFSSSPITVGDDGVIRPGILFSMAPELGQRQPTAYPAFDTLSGKVVIGPNQNIQQVVRVDQSALLGVLAQTVNLAFQVDGQVATNPDGAPGGYAVRLTKPFVRTSVLADVPKAVADLNGGLPKDRVTALGVLQAYVQTVRSVRNLEPKVAQALVGLATDVQRARNDPTPAVAAWATVADFVLSPTPGHPATIRAMAADPNWRTRQLSLLLLPVVNDPALSKEVVAKLADDPQDSVKAYAVAAQGLIAMGLPSNGIPPPAPHAATPAAPVGIPMPPP